MRIGSVSDELVEAVNYLFHYTTLNDTQLAARCLTDYQLHTTFLHRARAHVATGLNPILQLAPRLDEETTGELKATQARLKALQQAACERFEQAS